MWVSFYTGEGGGQNKGDNFILFITFITFFLLSFTFFFLFAFFFFFLVKKSLFKPAVFIFCYLLSFLSLRVFGQLSSSLLLFPQRFGRYVLRPSSSVRRTLEPSRNFELRPLYVRGSPVLIPSAITGYKC